MYSLWRRRDKVSEATRIKLYNAFVLPVLMYNCCNWGPTAADLQHVDVFHRRQLRSLIGVHYPTPISNADLYKRCGSSPISDKVNKSRLSMLGHVLRMDTGTPPQQAMAQYFGPPQKAKPGRPVTTLGTVVQSDCARHDINLKSRQDLLSLRERSRDRDEWRGIWL